MTRASKNYCFDERQGEALNCCVLIITSKKTMQKNTAIFNKHKPSARYLV